MREIKFRAWDEVLEEFVLWKKFKEYYNWAIFENDKVKVMQYTGLKDKNGKEIYEGDMLKVGEWEPKEVIWKSEGIVSYILKHTDYFLGSNEPYEIEIIGNIYENEELLEDKS